MIELFCQITKQLWRIKLNGHFEDEEFETENIRDYLYRPFEIKNIYYKSNLLGRSRESIMKHFFKPNIGLIISKQFGGHKHFICFITNSINDKSSQPFAPYYNHPLYLYPEAGEQTEMFAAENRTPNLNMEIVGQIADKLKLEFEAEKTVSSHQLSVISKKFAPIDILDYIYAVLHSPSYREKYKEFLKIDFPRVPFPKDAATFWKLVNLGGELRQIHLLESAKVEEYTTQYPIGGDNIVGKTRFDNGKVWINETQYFDNVPEIAWNFYIGGYQPAQKWLKDRKDRTLGYEDIFHYQKIIAALSATDALMREIDEIGIE